jgi:hypothetical protein
VKYESEKVDDRIGFNNFKIDRFNADHIFNWGRNSALRSRFLAFDRTGVAANRRVTLNETADVQHTDSLSSRTIYRFIYQEANDSSTSNNGSFQLRHDLYGNLNTAGRIFGRTYRSSNLDENELGADLDVNYHKTFDRGFWVSAGIRGNYSRLDRMSQGGIGNIADEPHVASFIPPIILSRNYVLQRTILVSSRDDGFIYEEGFDYEVVQFGGLYTQVRIIPSGRIFIGERLFIAYDYVIQPSVEYDKNGNGYSLGAGYGRFRIYHRYNQADYDLISGFEDSMPTDWSNTLSGMAYNWRSKAFFIDLGVEYRQFRNGDYRQDILQFNQSLSYTISSRFIMTFAGVQSNIESEGNVRPLFDFEFEPKRMVDFKSFDLKFDWRPSSTLSVRPTVGVWSRQEDRIPIEPADYDRRYFTVSLTVTWRVRKIFMDFNYWHNASTISSVDRVEDRVWFRLRRVFR